MKARDLRRGDLVPAMRPEQSMLRVERVEDRKTPLGRAMKLVYFENGGHRAYMADAEIAVEREDEAA